MYISCATGGMDQPITLVYKFTLGAAAVGDGLSHHHGVEVQGNGGEVPGPVVTVPPGVLGTLPTLRDLAGPRGISHWEEVIVIVVVIFSSSNFIPNRIITMKDSIYE